VTRDAAHTPCQPHGEVFDAPETELFTLHRECGLLAAMSVVWDPTTSHHELVHLPDPGHRLEHVAREVRLLSHIELPAEAIGQSAEPRR